MEWCRSRSSSPSPLSVPGQCSQTGSDNGEPPQYSHKQASGHAVHRRRWTAARQQSLRSRLELPRPSALYSAWLCLCVLRQSLSFCFELPMGRVVLCQDWFPQAGVQVPTKLSVTERQMQMTVPGALLADRSASTYMHIHSDQRACAGARPRTQRNRIGN